MTYIYGTPTSIIATHHINFNRIIVVHKLKLKKCKTDMGYSNWSTYLLVRGCTWPKCLTNSEFYLPNCLALTIRSVFTQMREKEFLPHFLHFLYFCFSPYQREFFCGILQSITIIMSLTIKFIKNENWICLRKFLPRQFSWMCSKVLLTRQSTTKWKF